jgi:hypothetical protein
LEAKVKKERALTKREELFVSEFPKDWNASRALIAAGYAESFVSHSTEMLNRPHIKTALDKYLNKIKKPNRRTADWVLTRMEHLADIGSDENGPYFNPRTAIQALDSLGKYHKIFTEKIEISVREDLGDKIMDARKRSAITATETTERLPDGTETITKQITYETENTEDIDVESLLA